MAFYFTEKVDNKDEFLQLPIYFQTYLCVFSTFPSDISFIDHLLSTVVFFFVCLILTQGYAYVFKIDFTETGKGREREGRREGGREEGRKKGGKGEGDRQTHTSVIEKHHRVQTRNLKYVP